MKQLFTCLFLLTFSLQLAAQITLERSDYTLTLEGSDLVAPTNNNEMLTIPTSGENLTWDYTNLMFSLQDSFSRRTIPQGSDALVPEANSIVSLNILSPLLPGLVFNTTFYQVLDQDGFRTLAKFDDSVDYPIGAITGVPQDSLNFLPTLSLYEDPSIQSQFPINFNDNIGPYFQNLKSDFLLTASPFGLDHVPGRFTAYLKLERNTNGWGTLIINDPKTGTPVELEVLLVEQKKITTDSVFLAGMPAPPSLMGAFGLTQGTRDTSYQYEFWTKGLPGPVFIIHKKSVSLSGNISLGISGLVLSSTQKTRRDEFLSIEVFPNPSQGDFYLKFEKKNVQPLVLNLYNAIGQMIHQQNIQSAVGHTNTLITPSVKSSGMHHFILRKEAGDIVASGKVLLNE